MSKNISDALKAILDNDTFIPDIALEEKAKIKPTPLTNTFLDIVSFYEQHGRLPSLTKAVSIKEKSLYKAFTAIKENPALIDILKPLDAYDLLNPANAFNKKEDVVNDAPQTLNDILNDLDGVFGDEETDLFDIRYSRKIVNKPDFIAKPKSCLDYDVYKDQFEKINRGLENGDVKATKFKYKLGLRAGDYFIYKGLIGLFVSQGKKFIDKGDRENYRCKVIYNNQTEIDVLYLSLLRGMLKEGMKIIPLTPGNKSKANGCVYVLSTLSTDPALDPYRDNLYKIGSTNRKLNQRIAHAEKSTTYLEAPVDVVAEVICTGNVVPKKLEKTIHRILTKRRLNVTLVDSDGKTYSPKEWFVVPFDTIKDIMLRINNGTIHQYYVNAIDGKLIKK